MKIEILDELKEQYKKMLNRKQGDVFLKGYGTHKSRYITIKLFCTSCNLVSSKDIEKMEHETEREYITKNN